MHTLNTPPPLKYTDIHRHTHHLLTEYTDMHVHTHTDKIIQTHTRTHVVHGACKRVILFLVMGV